MHDARTANLQQLRGVQRRREPVDVIGWGVQQHLHEGQHQPFLSPKRGDVCSRTEKARQQPQAFVARLEKSEII